jgi:hypothetical protein
VWGIYFAAPPRINRIYSLIDNETSWNNTDKYEYFTRNVNRIEIATKVRGPDGFCKSCSTYRVMRCVAAVVNIGLKMYGEAVAHIRRNMFGVAVARIRLYGEARTGLRVYGKAVALRAEDVFQL